MILPLAAATTRITLGTLVVCTSFRPPALAAKMADTIDEMSRERLILGLDAGWHQPSIKLSSSVLRLRPPNSVYPRHRLDSCQAGEAYSDSLGSSVQVLRKK
ncbi:MAG: LLM class flavin-dependent oxidoreductase [Ktedonobacteraceae bacterium]